MEVRLRNEDQTPHLGMLTMILPFRTGTYRENVVFMWARLKDLKENSSTLILCRWSRATTSPLRGPLRASVAFSSSRAATLFSRAPTSAHACWMRTATSSRTRWMRMCSHFRPCADLSLGTTCWLYYRPCPDLSLDSTCWLYYRPFTDLSLGSTCWLYFPTAGSTVVGRVLIYKTFTAHIPMHAHSAAVSSTVYAQFLTAVPLWFP